MRILITTWRMDEFAGTSLYVRELALELHKRGHSPAVYSPQLGDMAKPLVEAGIPVEERIASLGDFEPEIIHAQHHLEALTALLSFPGAPAVFLSHGAFPSQEFPLAFPRILRYLAVSETARERASTALGMPAASIELCRNWVNLERFTPRGPLPERPRRALMLGNNFTEGNGVAMLRAVCRRHGLDLDARGMGVNHVAEAPETILPDYDLVFALGKAAIEAMAVGCGVILCHPSGVGPLVTRDNLEPLRAMNFGTGALEEPLGAEAVSTRIRSFSAAAAAQAAHQVRATTSLEQAVDRLLEIYCEVRCQFSRNQVRDAARELDAAARFLAEQGPELLMHRDTPRRLEAWDPSRDELERRVREMEASLTWKAGRAFSRIPLLKALLSKLSA